MAVTSPTVATPTEPRKRSATSRPPRRRSGSLTPWLFLVDGFRIWVTRPEILDAAPSPSLELKYSILRKKA